MTSAWNRLRLPIVLHAGLVVFATSCRPIFHESASHPCAGQGAAQPGLEPPERSAIAITPRMPLVMPGSTGSAHWLSDDRRAQRAAIGRDSGRERPRPPARVPASIRLAALTHHGEWTAL